MKPSNQKGFTIIEVVLFLALSGLFMGIAFVGIQGRTAAVQFTDSMRSLQSFLVSEQNKVLNGVNSNGASGCSTLIPTGLNEDCILMGRVVTFGAIDGPVPGVPDPSKVGVTILRGDRITTDNMSGKSDFTLIHDSFPASDGIGETYSISWDTGLVDNIHKSRDIKVPLTNTALHSIGWVRSPSSSRIVPVAFAKGVDLSDTGNTQSNFTDSKEAGGNPLIRMDANVQAKLCFEGSTGKVASIVFGDGEGGVSIVLEFDDPECK